MEALLQPTFDQTMASIYTLAVTNPRDNRFTLIKYEVRAIVLEVILLAQYALLLPLQIVGKPLFWLTAKVWPRSQKCYNKFPETLFETVWKVVWLIIGLFWTATLGFFFAEANIHLHRDNGLIPGFSNYQVVPVPPVEQQNASPAGNSQPAAVHE